MRRLASRWRRRASRSARRAIQLSPPAVLTILYAALVVLGAGLLMLPVSINEPLTWSEAVFTSASAVTVTGLVVVDTGSHFTLFGQAVIAGLIQLGGLGLMTFAVLVLGSLGLSMGLPSRLTLREDLGQTSLRDLAVLVRLIIVVVAGCTALGTAALAFAFVPDLGWSAGLWHALFHAVSAFNNAGFALWPDSLTGYATDPLVNLVVPGLFIVGGIGFAVIADLWGKRAWAPLTLHSKLMLVGTAALILWGWAAFAALEWTNPETLGLYEHGWERAMVAWFQGVTPRTAGFNTADIGATRDETSFMIITLMLVGGGPTSTAGGIKVTTFIVLLLATFAFFKRRAEISAFGRTVPSEDLMRVTALVSVAILLMAVATFLILLRHRGDFMDLTFEAASAFGTVGLSRGSTGDLDATGRAVVIFLMFAGRVGPLTLGFFLATRTRPRVRYPKGSVFLG
jgi:trk system potassium uptake protein TrkH